MFGVETWEITLFHCKDVIPFVSLCFSVFHIMCSCNCYDIPLQLFDGSFARTGLYNEHLGLFVARWFIYDSSFTSVWINFSFIIIVHHIYILQWCNAVIFYGVPQHSALIVFALWVSALISSWKWWICIDYVVIIIMYIL